MRKGERISESLAHVPANLSDLVLLVIVSEIRRSVRNVNLSKKQIGLL